MNRNKGIKRIWNTLSLSNFGFNRYRFDEVVHEGDLQKVYACAIQCLWINKCSCPRSLHRFKKFFANASKNLQFPFYYDSTILKRNGRNPIKRCRKTLFQLIDLMKTLTKGCWTPFYCEFDINYNFRLTNLNDTKIWNQTQVGLS